MLAPPPASPESAGMSKQGVDRLEAHIKDRYIDAGRFPGTQLLVYRRGKVVVINGFRNQFPAFLVRLLPRAVVRKIARRLNNVK